MYKFETHAETVTELRDKIKSELIRLNFELGEDPIANDRRHIYETQVEQVSPVVESASAVPSPQHTQQTVATSTTVGSTELDSRGLPWDVRIHSKERSRNKDESWRYKRGVEDEIVKQVEAELKLTLPAANLTHTPLQPVPTVENVVPFVAPPQLAPQVFVAPVAPVVQQAPPPPPTPMPSVKPAHSLISFKNNLTLILAQFVNEGKIDQAYIDSLKTHFGVKEIWNILASEKQCIELYEMFIHIGFVTRVEG